ncbi:hypothetical protein P4639_22195 [Priestia megaterium]|uniref:hypothetical protein n=1 Tax=Priestia megaterium TaxID=1404 RepID=UPI002E233566|nr:hypothetical protein [Priestia megaterium]
MVKKFKKLLKEFYQHVVKNFYNWRYTWLGIWLGGFASQLGMLLDKNQDITVLVIEAITVLIVILILITFARAEQKGREQ